MVPSGSGKGGMSSPVPVQGVSLFESRSISQMSSGSLEEQRLRTSYEKQGDIYLKFFLYIKKLAGSPMTYGVGASRS